MLPVIDCEISIRCSLGGNMQRLCAYDDKMFVVSDYNEWFAVQLYMISQHMETAYTFLVHCCLAPVPVCDASTSNVNVTAGL